MYGAISGAIWAGSWPDWAIHASSLSSVSSAVSFGVSPIFRSSWLYMFLGLACGAWGAALSQILGELEADLGQRVSS